MTTHCEQCGKAADHQFLEGNDNDCRVVQVFCDDCARKEIAACVRQSVSFTFRANVYDGEA